MQNAQQPNIQTTAKIIWGALSASILLYGVVLQITGKLASFAVPSGMGQPLELVALVAPFIIFASITLHRTLMGKAKSAQDKVTATVVPLAMNESIAVLGFVATFMSEQGNGFFFIVNAVIGLIGNVLVFPSGDWEKKNF